MSGQIKKLKRKSKNIWRQMKMKTQWSKYLGCNKCYSKRKVYNNIGLPQEVRKTSNNLTLYLKDLKNEQQQQQKTQLTHEHMETKQHAIKQAMGQQRIQRGNKKIHGDK